MATYEQYEHHGKMMWVNSELKGKHRDHCLCFSCEKFHMVNPDKKCKIADRIFQSCVDCYVVTTIWECSAFVEYKENG